MLREEQERGMTTMSWAGRTPTVAIVGSGFAGLGMAVRLKQAGVESFTILEKGAEVGGVWRDNTYPGCGGDVPSHLYSYSFEKYRSTSQRYPAQREILGYLQQVAEKYGLRRHLRLNCEVASARYDESTGTWTVATVGGERHTVDVVVFGVGQLDRPYVPDFAGREAFRGVTFHSARWDHDRDLTGRDVAVIGTGSSAAQLIPQVASQARRLYVFQRTASWVIPKPRERFGSPTRLAFGWLPALQAAYRCGVYLAAEAVLWPVVVGGWSASPMKWVARRHLARQVPDPRLRRQLTPDYPIGCKRIVIDSSFYPALSRPNVELVTAKIARMTDTGIQTEDGLVHRVDTIVYATGFRTTEFLAPMEIVGRDGRKLREEWKDGAQAYLGMAVSHFPNLFLLHGPNTILGHNSNIFMIECQVRYVIECLRVLSNGHRGSLEVRPEAMADYQRRLDRSIRRTVWRAGCQSWYKTDAGRVTNPWPRSTVRYWWSLRQVDRAAFHTVPTRPAAANLSRSGAPPAAADAGRLLPAPDTDTPARPAHPDRSATLTSR
jgi:cation diffusion facilitator CzcD-associated flavoprotein CzcO